MMRNLALELSGWLAHWRSKHLVTDLSPWIPEFVKSVPWLMDVAPAADWRIQKIHPTLSDMRVVTLGCSSSQMTIILQLPGTHRAVSSFQRQKAACDRLHENKRLGDWRRFVPKVLHEGAFRGRPYWFVRRLPGITAAEAMLDSEARSLVLKNCVETILFLFQTTARQIILNDSLKEEWIKTPIRCIRRSVLIRYHRQSDALLKKVEAWLMDVFRHRYVATSWIHGDYWPANILVSPKDLQVTGIVDWDRSQPSGFPGCDLVNLFTSTRQIHEGRELGDILSTIIKRETWPENEQEIWKQAEEKLGVEFPAVRESIVIFWLHHIHANLDKSRRYSLNPIWAIRNFVKVMDALHPGLA